MDTTFWFELGGVLAGIGAGAISAVVFLLRKRKIGLPKPHDLKMPASCNWDVHTQLHETLTELRVKTDCARAQIVQFHNGGEFLNGVSMKKQSLTHESLRKGVSSEREVKQDLLLSMCIDGLTLVLEDNPEIYMVSDLEDSWCKQFMENSNTIAFSFLPIRQNNQAIGYVMSQWCSLAKADEIDTEIVSEWMETSRKIIEIQLAHQLNRHR
tara:strand:+ start:518 stop:1150 length:633 start_codon:yes stop_codon:yes gene_type:complete